MRLAVLLLFAVSVFAQASGSVIALHEGALPSTPVPPGHLTLPTAPAQSSETVWVGAGGFQGQHHAVPAVFGAVRLATATWSWNSIEFASLGHHPLVIQTTMEAGIAQRIATYGSVDVFAIFGGGPSVTGSSVGGSFAGGFLGQASIGRGATIGVFARVQQVTGSISASSVMLGLVVGVGR